MLKEVVYDINDEVWCIFENKVRKFTIKEILVSKNNVIYYDGNKYSFHLKHLFKTKQDLLDSL
jgi:hypothetical protein